MSYNLSQGVPLTTNDGTTLEEVSDFKYLRAWMASTEKDINMRKGAAWRACSKLTKIWKSTLPKRCPEARHWTGDIRGTDSNAGYEALEGHSSSRTPLDISH